MNAKRFDKRQKNLNCFGIDHRIGVAIILAIAGFLCAVPPSDAQASQNTALDQSTFQDDTWHVNLSPYLWLAGMNGTVGFGGREVQVKQSFTDIFSNLKAGVMGLTEVQRGPVSFLTDVMWVRLGNETAIPITGLPNATDVNTSLDTFTLTPYFGYRLLGNDKGAINYILGARYYHIGSTISAMTTAGKVSTSTSDNWADVVGGGRFELNLTPRVNAFFLGEAGGGGSLLTWQIIGGAGYRLSKRWTSQLAYRRLYFNRQNSNGFGLEQTQQGLVLGITFRIRDASRP